MALARADQGKQHGRELAAAPAHAPKRIAGDGKDGEAEPGQRRPAQATMRRSVASAASIGTTTIQGMSQEVRPPVSHAQ